ncbi:phosphotransferase [Dinoroseobacter sp. PD6]|uniref:phosphotransferase enzyme family protein n=1 Tax=Dinoroseobacter sp. PD6 TaxID=3028384 RepID=UPI00237BF764|nr:phosphotransferase [Dinoroseobacter sp. PD6]MDD9717801.1 phosphotransferase [Dinoroseobacter sp. PD6]
MPALIATEAQAAWGCVGTPELLSHRENAVFAVRLPDGARAALRVHRPGYKTAAEIAEELAFCAGLAGAGIACPRGVPTLAGDWLWHGQDGQVVSVVSWVAGAPLGAGDQDLPPEAPRLYAELGATLAQMHQAAAGLGGVGSARPAWDLDGLTGPDPIWGRYWESPCLSSAEAALMIRARNHARGILGDAGGELIRGMVHADPLRENVFVTKTGLALIDFDDCGPGFRAYDIAVALTQSLDDPALPVLRQSIVGGYAEVSALSEAELACLPVFSMLRSCCALAWVGPRFAASHPKLHLYKARALRAAEAVLAKRDILAG